MAIGSDNKFPKVIITEGSAPASPSAGDQKVYIDSSDHHLKLKNSAGAVTDLQAVSINGSDGWVSDANTWSYSSVDAPTGIISINADMTALIGVGDRIKITQTTAKYFIVTVVGAFAAGATLITVYGGTDYTLANAAITSPYYSHVHHPFGFPLDPAKWTQSASNTSQQQMNGNSPAANTWYNSISLSIPIGLWVVFYEVVFQMGHGSSVTQDMKHTLSTANNSESATANSVYLYVAALTGEIATFSKRIDLGLAAKATYYLNHMTTIASANVFQTRGDVSATKIVAVCAYL
jgi:hypothetical protein